MTYNHAFTLGFAVTGSSDPDGFDVKPDRVREALVMKLMTMTDTDLMENIGAPFDSHEEEPTK